MSHAGEPAPPGGPCGSCSHVSRFEFAADRTCNYVNDLATGQSARHNGFGMRT